MEQWKDLALQKAVHVDNRSQLPPTKAPAAYKWPSGTSTLKGTERMLLEQLRKRPVFCASRMQLSTYVSRLRDNHGVPIHTFSYRNKDTGGQFGVYCLADRVTPEHV